MTDFRELLDLASVRLGGSVLHASDEFFAGKENLIKSSPPVWKEEEYTDRGKWMDGWESRRRRTPGHDFCLVRLGVPGVIRGVVVDTSFFRGNYPESCSLEGCSAPQAASPDDLLSGATHWVELLPQSKLQGDAQNLLSCQPAYAVTHVRFNIFPDGGVARLRLHGDAVPDWHLRGGLSQEVDLAAAEHGGEVLTCSDMFFGPKHNLIMPGRALNMGDGWETKRRRGPGHDWVIVKLATEGTIRRIEADTNHFKGNYPDGCSIDVCRLEEPSGNIESAEWSELLPRTKLLGDTRHLFRDELQQQGPVTHIRLNVFPDGGVSRLRVHGVATERGRKSQVVRRIDTLVPPAAAAELLRCCGSSRWVDAMLRARPFGSWDTFSAVADERWWELGRADWLEAFAAHPRIGERKTTSSWSQEEQASALDATQKALADLERANREYETRFGHIFIVCAAGKGAEEMLALVKERLRNDSESELRIAAEEQRKITQLRLQKLVE
ncbi:MAG TPA: allantoicase [Thermoanaerobaculia bacterium]|nr:allantoicase [Thermoanaerobaculia bacterium]